MNRVTLKPSLGAGRFSKSMAGVGSVTALRSPDMSFDCGEGRRSCSVATVVHETRYKKAQHETDDDKNRDRRTDRFLEKARHHELYERCREQGHLNLSVRK